MKCGACYNFGSCTHKKDIDEASSCFYPDIYMQTAHPDEYRKLQDDLDEKAGDINE